MKKTTILFVIGILLWVFMAGVNLFAEDATECYARLGYIPNSSVTVNTDWSLAIPIQMKVTCDFDINLQFIQGPAGMTFNGSKLFWTPTYAQLGQTYPVTVRLTVTYDSPYRVVVSSKTFYLTVVDCTSADVGVSCAWENRSGFDMTAKVTLRNYSSCYATTSGLIYVDDNFQGQWTNFTLAPNASVVIWAYTYANFLDGVSDILFAQITSSSPTDPKSSNNQCSVYSIE